MPADFKVIPCIFRILRVRSSAISTALPGAIERVFLYASCMEQRQEQPATEATDQERQEARARFRRKLAAAEARMTPEKRAKARAVFGLPASPA